MTRFECPQCGLLVEALALQAWHRCAGRVRELRPVAPVEKPSAPPDLWPVAQGRLF